MRTLIEQLEAIVGSGGVISGADLAARPTSWRRPESCQALAIVRPGTTAELSRVMRLCYDNDQPVIAAGGNTGLVDGTLHVANEVRISTERMTKIDWVDVAGSAMQVGAGVAIQTVQDAAEEAGLLFAVDFGARGTATVGGAISTNAGGNGVIRYGMMREQVLGLEVVLADGTVMTSLNRMLKNNAGYDLKQLFIGTEGTLGIVTRAVLRLRPGPASDNTALVAVDDFDAVTGLLRRLSDGFGGTLSAFEVLWADFYDTVVTDASSHTAPLPHGHAFYVLVESAGGDPDADAERFQSVLGGALEAGEAADVVIASSSAQRDALWAIRDDIESLEAAMPDAVTFDISLPTRDANDYVNSVRERLQKRWGDAASSVTFGHLGDGNIHLMILPGEHGERAETETMEIVYEALGPYGGSISGEHGIGLEKRAYLPISRSATEIALMHSLKGLLDPKGLLNPGKVVGG